MTLQKLLRIRFLAVCCALAWTGCGAENGEQSQARQARNPQGMEVGVGAEQTDKQPAPESDSMAAYREEPTLAVLNLPRTGQRLSVLVWANGAIAVRRHKQWLLGRQTPETVEETLRRLLVAGFFAKDASESHCIVDGSWTTIWARRQHAVTELSSSHEFYANKKGVVFTERGVSLRSPGATRSPSPEFVRFLERWEFAKQEILALSHVKLRPCGDGQDLLEYWRPYRPKRTSNDTGSASEDHGSGSGGAQP
jgi:hypothetical protein